MVGMTPHASTTLQRARSWLRVLRLIDRKLDRGVTLIEAMMVVAILGILLATAVPSFANLLANHRASTTANDLLHAMMLARSEAMRRGARVYLAPIDGRWRNGWTIFVDRNDNRSFDASDDELITRHDALSASIVVTNPANANRESFTDVGSPQRTYVMFDAGGYARQRNGGFIAGSIAIADRSGTVAATRTLCVAAFGRVRVVNAASCS